MHQHCFVLRQKKSPDKRAQLETSNVWFGTVNILGQPRKWDKGRWRLPWLAVDNMGTVGLQVIREGVKNPRHGNFPLGGYPPPLHGRSVSENGYFFAENGAFCPKNTVFGPIFNGFFLNGKGGYPPSPPPPRTVGSRKPNGKKLTEKGGTPPSTESFRAGGF